MKWVLARTAVVRGPVGRCYPAAGDYIASGWHTMFSGRINPDFHLDREQIRAERVRMRADPRSLARPVVVLAGWRSPSVQGFSLADKLAPLTSGHRGDFTSVSYALAGDIESAARRARSVLEGRFRGASGEVDVVGISMGGLVARLLMAEDPPVGLRIRRLFTIATPHTGAGLARWVRPDRAARAMRPGSPLLARLDDRLAAEEFELICYAQLRDWWVGASRAHPPGRGSHWIDATSPIDRIFSHFTSPRRWPIVLDIARRLRGESPLARTASRPPGD
ncbi:MAG: alpha/beta hydrolase [Phycisphaerales bacterium]|nr:alpha/beta hydrolase [Phycisphaerales bacterium]